MTCAGRRLVDGVVSWAVVMTYTGVNEHHRSPDDLVLRALELHLSCLCAVRGAAPAVTAQPTKPRSVDLDTGAILQGEVNDIGASLCS